MTRERTELYATLDRAASLIDLSQRLESQAGDFHEGDETGDLAEKGSAMAVRLATDCLRDAVTLDDALRREADALARARARRAGAE